MIVLDQDRRAWFVRNWWYVLSDGLLHVGAVVAFFHWSWSGFLAAIILMQLLGPLGITLGYHRLLTHRSFETFRVIRWILAVLGTLNWQGGPIEWVGTHRAHHAKADHHGDPHTPKDGLIWAHLAWVMSPLAFDPSRYAKDLERDRGLLAIERLWFLFPVSFLFMLYAVGEIFFNEGLSWLLWAGCVRSVLVLHAGWAVNSWTHRWGYRNFSTKDHSTNSPTVAFLTAGEGWHNNHHAFPRSAAHGMFKGEFDLTYQFIRIMERLGLAWNVVHPDRYPLQERLIRGEKDAD